MITTEKCPGSREGNEHYLSILCEQTGNKICENDRCYFVIQYPDKSGCWANGFDPCIARSFIKPEKEKK